jgi:hypothetical protein
MINIEFILRRRDNLETSLSENWTEPRATPCTESREV